MRSDSVAGGAARLAERQHRRPASAEARRHLHGHLAARVLSLPARAPSDRAGHVVAGEHAHSHAGDHQRPPGDSLPRHGAVPPRCRVAVVRAQRDRSVLRRGRRVLSVRRTRTNVRACDGAWTCPPTNSSSCSRAGSATRRIRKRFCAPSRSPVRRGLDAVLLNLGGGHREFLALPARLGIDDASSWLLARPAVHPMKDLADYFRAADALAMASLAEGAGYFAARSAGLWDARRRDRGGRNGGAASGYASLTPRQDAAAMADALLAIAASPDAARAQARAGREYVCREWSRAEGVRRSGGGVANQWRNDHMDGRTLSAGARTSTME